MTIDWNKPVELLDGTTLTLSWRLIGPNPDSSGVRYFMREDGKSFAGTSVAVPDGCSLVVRRDGTQWGRDSDKVVVRNREPLPTPTITERELRAAMRAVMPMRYDLTAGTLSGRVLDQAVAILRDKGVFAPDPTDADRFIAEFPRFAFERELVEAVLDWKANDDA